MKTLFLKQINHLSALRMSVIVVLLVVFYGNTWGGTHYCSATTADPAQGLVYMSKTNSAPSDSQYKYYSPGGSLVSTANSNSSESNSCYIQGNGSGCTPSNEYYWAKPVRGYVFSSWQKRGTNYAAHPASATGGCNTSDELNQGPYDGSADVIQSTAGGSQATWIRPIANFTPATKYIITYAVPVGGSYDVSYSYYAIKDNGTESKGNYTEKTFYTKTDDYSFTSSSESKAVDSYAADKITLSTSATNFEAWYNGSTQLSTSKSYQIPEATIKASPTIKAIFKSAVLGEAEDGLSPVQEAETAGELTSQNKTITIPVTATGTLSSGNFTITFTKKTDPGSNTIKYTANSHTYSAGTLIIPYTFAPSGFYNAEYDVTVTPQSGFGVAKTYTIKASSNQLISYQAKLFNNQSDFESNTVRSTGDLVDMVAEANGLSTKPVVLLMQDVTITSTLSLKQSMKFDFNDKTITCTAAKAFSIDVANIDVQIEDGGFSQVGKIAVESSQSGTVSVVTFTQQAKLTMKGGTLSAKNTGSGPAYGLDVRNGSVFYMTGGNLTVTANSGEARGVNVATTSDYATFEGGDSKQSRLIVSAPTKAYGLWSAGQGNITNTIIEVNATTGSDAYGVYVNGGVSTFDKTDVTVNAKTSKAYGAYVNADRVNINAGSLTVTAVTQDACGVQIQSGTTAVVQQNTNITVSATNASATNVIGINNAGTATLANITLTATSPNTGAIAVNIASGATATAINGGSYTARSATGVLYGLHHQSGSLNIDEGLFRAIGSGTPVYAIRSTQNASIANATLYAEAQESGNTVYGFDNETAGKTVTLDNCDITALSANNKAYAVYSKANLTATGCTLTATTNATDEAYGLYAGGGTNRLVNCNATVTANTIKAYGINHVSGALTIEGGSYNVEAKQATTAAAQNSELYGIYNAASQTINIIGAEFIVTASNNAYSQTVFGAYINGILNSSNSTYTVKGAKIVRGIYGNTSSTLNLSGNNIYSEATNLSSGTDSQGIYSTKNFTIDGDIVKAKGSTTNIYAMYFSSGAIGNVLDGKFSAVSNGTNNYGPINAAGTVGKVYLKGGVYTTAINLQKYAYTGYSVYNLDDTHPDYAGGYRYIVATSNPSPYVCYIVGGNKYTTLEAALKYTKDNSGNFTIVMTQDYTMPAGDYVLPSNATLLVPYKSEQTSIAGATPIKRSAVGLLEEFICLTFASGVNLNVDGKIEVGGEMYSVETGRISYNNSPYGRIRMEEGSVIQLNSGAYLYAWGFITGKGDIKVKSNAEVHEMFQIADMKSMSNIGYVYYNNDYDFFFISQYFVQNIEVPTTYYYNSRLICSMMDYYKGEIGDDNIKLVGTSGALFLVTTDDESAWVRKSYDAEHDYQIWEVNSQAQLGSLTMKLQNVPMVGNITFNSSAYILPITHNMKIHILDGEFTVTQDTELLPGSSIEINKTASLKIASGKSLYVFDNDQWPFTGTTSNSVNFSPSWKNGTKPSRTVGDAALNVHGNINVNGKFYTSKSIATTSANASNATNGANIYSNNADAGTVKYNVAAANTATLTLITGVSSNSAVTNNVTMDPAQLKNGDASFTQTSGTAASESFAYFDNRWQKTYQNGCFFVQGSTVYAKPSEYVALKYTETVGGKLQGKINADHTYTTIADKLLILVDDCQWWEVEPTSDPDVFECKKSGYEGFYHYTGSEWELIQVEVVFYSQETGSTILKEITTDWMGIPDQSVIATNPTKATTAAATYNFYGWESSVTGLVYKWTEPLEPATEDMSYRPRFTENKRNYTITLNDANNGAAVPLEVPYGELPEYTPIKDPTAQYTYTFNNWQPPLAAVTGKTSYTALWNSVVNKYTIKWRSDGLTLETDVNQAYGTATAYNGTFPPTKEPDDKYAYTFSKWKSSLNGNEYSNGSTPTVSGNTTYEAQFTTTPRYLVTFVNFNGTELGREIYTTGETPSYSGTPARVRDRDGFYKFDGWKNSAGTKYAVGAALPAVTKKETYTAQFVYVPDRFLITLRNCDGNDGTWSETFGVGSIPYYYTDDENVSVTPSKAGDAQYSYEFKGWSLTKDGTKIEPYPTVTGVATYWALFEQTINKYTITWKSEDGTVTLETDKNVPYNTATAFNKDDPEKAPVGDTYYRFVGWTTLPNGAGTAYDKGATPPATSDATYYVRFGTLDDKYDIVWYNWDGSATLETDAQVKYGKATTYNSSTPTRPTTAQYTYTFDGWATTPNGDKVYDNGSTPMVSGNASYYAHFDAVINNYDLTISASPAGYGTVSQTSVTSIPYGTAITITGNSFTVDEIIVSASPSATTAEYTYAFSEWENVPATVVGNVTNIHALFTRTARTYNIVLNTNSGTINAGNLTSYTYGTGAALPSNVTRDYYDFGGWYADSEFTGSAVTSIASTATGDKEYWAKWTPKSYTVTLNRNSGTINAGNVTSYIYGTGATLPTDVTRDYYDFGGWYANSGLTGSAVTTISTTDNGNKEYWAKWTPKSYTVTLNVNSGTINAGNVTSYTYGTGATLPSNVTRDHYTFGGWYANSGLTGSAVTTISTSDNGDKEYWAKWTPLNYTVTWNATTNGGTCLTPSTTKPYDTEIGTLPVPSKDCYDFAGWFTESTGGTEISASTKVLGNVTYYAQFTIKKFTVTWKNYDGTPLETDENVECGSAPSYDGSTPTKPNSITNSFEFAGWTPTPATVTSAQTYTATYNEIPLQFTINYKDEGNVAFSGVHGADHPEKHVYGTPTTLVDPSKVGYDFVGWYNNSACTGSKVTTLGATDYTSNDEIILYAKWSVHTNQLTWIFDGGTPTSDPYTTSGNVAYGTSIVYPTVTKYGHTFASWDKPSIATMPDEPLTITASWTTNTHKLSWDFDGGTPSGDYTLANDAVAYGTTIVYPTVSREGYDFVSWENATVTMPDADLALKAVWEIKKFTVTIIAAPAGYGTVSQTSVINVPYNTVIAVEDNKITVNGTEVTATPTSADVQYSYEFVEWDGIPAKITEAVNIAAGFDRITNKYAITWLDGNDNPLKVEDVEYGSTPTYTGDKPTKTPTDEFSYSFNNSWLPVIATVTGPATYTAQFDATTREYTIRWKDGDGNVLDEKQVLYGATPVYGGGIPSKTTDDACTYTFNNDWAPAIGTVTGAVDYYAQFDCDKKTYTITWVDGDGNTLGSDDVEYGETPVYSGATPTKTATVEYSYAFNDSWSPTLAAVTGAQTYTAQFDAIKNKYDVTFDLQGHGVDIDKQNLEYGSKVVQPSAPYADDWSFEGWYKEAECTNAWNFASDEVTGNTTLYAKWIVETDKGPFVDIIDWNGTTVTLNMNDYDVATWDKVQCGSTVVLKSEMAADGKMTIIATSAIPDEKIRIKVLNGSTVESTRTYTVPHVFNGNANLGTVLATSVVFARSGKLTVNANTPAGTIYVAPDAELAINSGKTLTVGKLVMRSKAFHPSVFTNNGGTLAVTNMYYSRIVETNKAAYPFGLPFDVTLSATTLSNGKAAWAVGNYTFGLQKYDGLKRATNNVSVGNWAGQNPATVTKMDATVGYQLISTKNYYREYYFPIDYSKVKTSNAEVSVTKYSTGSSEAEHEGWNYIVSPYTYQYAATQSGDPSDYLKINLLDEDNVTYYQMVPDKIKPALPFFYQTPSNGTLSFGTTFVKKVPGKLPVQSVKTQWLQLHYLAAEDGAEDQTNIYLHPTKFSVDYELGYDVTKMSTSGNRPLIWSVLHCGDLAFAALPDSVAAQKRIPLTVFAPKADEMTFMLNFNNYLDRLESLLLYDTETGSVVNLLNEDYTYFAEQGTQSGRFYLQPVFGKSGVTTDVLTTEESGSVVITTDGRSIAVDNIGENVRIMCFDATGRLIAQSNGNRTLNINVPAAGVYMLQIGNSVEKVVIK